MRFFRLFSGYAFVFSAIALRVAVYFYGVQAAELSLFGVVPFDAMLLLAGFFLILLGIDGRALASRLTLILTAWRQAGRGRRHGS